MIEQELIENYLKGKLKGGELAAFEERMAKDAAFASDIADHKAVEELIFTQGLLDTKSKLNKIREIKSRQEKSKWTRAKWWGVIAVVVALVGIVLLVNDSNEKKTSPIVVAQKHEGETIKNNDSSSLKNSGKNDAINDDSKQHKKESEQSVHIPPYVMVEPQTDFPDKEVAIQPFIDNSSTIIDNKRKGADSSKVLGGGATTPIPCQTTTSVVTYSSEASCSDQATGRIILYNNNGSGGYFYSLDGSPYSEIKIFDNVSAGVHEVSIQDPLNCFYKLQANVGSKFCAPAKSKIFAPGSGNNECWEYPVMKNTNCKVRIYNRTGILVHEASIHNGMPECWDGRDIHGGDLPAAAYIYQINCDDGLQLQESVTISR
jgi:gliding motility-associated-like protein